MRATWTSVFSNKANFSFRRIGAILIWMIRLQAQTRLVATKKASVRQADVPTNFNPIWPRQKICSSTTKNWLVFGSLKWVRPFISMHTATKIYKGLIEPHFDYCSVVWDGLSRQLNERLQKLQNRRFFIAPLVTLAREKNKREARGGGGGISPPPPYSVKSSVFCWRSGLWRFSPRVQPSNKITRKWRAVNSLKNCATRVVTKSSYNTSSSYLLNSLSWDNLSVRRAKPKANLMHKMH